MNAYAKNANTGAAEGRDEMDDTISRQTVLDALDEIESEVADGMGYQYDKWRDYFIDLPSAQPEHTETHSCDCERTGTHGWIPVTERPPEDGVTVWVTIKGHDVIRCKDGETLEQAIARIRKIRWVWQGFYCETDKSWRSVDGFPMMVRPIAWMPMDTPEPYREGQDDES